MNQNPTTQTEDYYTLLCARPDGVASVVDVVPAEDFDLVRRRAHQLLREHGSCERVEVWRDGALREEVRRP